MSLALLLQYFEDPAAMPHFLTYFNMISTILLKRSFVSYYEGPIKTHNVWKRYRAFKA